MCSARRVAPGGLAVGLASVLLVTIAVNTTVSSALAVAASLLAVAACAVALAASEDAAAALRAVATGWLLAALASSAIALLQYAGYASDLSPWVNASPNGDAYANLRQRNHFATLTSIGLCALLWLGQDRPRMVAVGVFLLACGNAASASRTGLLQWLLIFLAPLAWPGPQRARWLRLAGTALVSYAAAALALPLALQWHSGTVADNVFARIAAQAACSTRSALWPNVIELIAARPLTGWGWGELDFAHYWHLYQGMRFCDILDNAHNLPLHLAVELGLPVALLVCTAAIWLVARQRFWRDSDPRRQLAWLVLACLALHSLVEYPLWYGPFQMAAGFAIGALWQPAREGARRAMGASLRVTTGIIGLACLFLVAWDYARVSQAYLPPEHRWSSWHEEPVSKLAWRSWLFQDHMNFAMLTLTPVTTQNAEVMLELAQRTLHFSPEPKVIEKVLESALVLGREKELAEHLVRYRAAFPDAYGAWMAGQPAR